MKLNKRKVVFGRKIWKLLEDSTRSDLSYYVKEFKERSKADTFVRVFGKSLKEVLLEVSRKTCG